MAVLILSLLISFFLRIITSDNEIIEIESGVQIHGSQMTTLNHKSFLAFRGIPYAEPPLGELRFRAPVSKKWSKKIFNATVNGPICVQSNLFALRREDLKGQEDCLVLNVFTPNTGKPLRKVMVFIHGGGFAMGSSNQYGPRRLLDHDLVLVTINYRLGLFGFLSTMDESSPGNYGLLDQAEALKWIQINIAAFGGDPNKVTIFGESSGAVSVWNHVISAVSKGLFHRAIAQSGNVLNPRAENRNPIYWTKLLADKVGCLHQKTNEIVKCLRKMPFQDLVKAANNLSDSTLIIFNPVADGFFHSDLPSKLFRRGQISNRVPILTGITKDEGIFASLMVYQKSPHLPIDDMIKKSLVATLNIEFKDITSDLVELVTKHYFSSDIIDTRNLQDGMADIHTDGVFAVPHYESVQYLLGFGIKPFLYSWDYVTNHSFIKKMGITENRGVAHLDDLFCLFDCEDFFPFDYTTPNDETENKFVDYWINFAENGCPSSDNFKWKHAQSDQIHVHHLDRKTTIRNYQPQTDWRLDFWLQQIPTFLINYRNKTFLKVVNLK